MAPLDHSWLKALEYIDYAFQPIVNIYSGECYGYEALLRGFDRAGFATIQALLDAAASQNVLHQVDLQLREIAVRKFTAISNLTKSIPLRAEREGRLPDRPRPPYDRIR
jgi:EAL domain-containing protein (putative c-di-GMP-specific phosphodiesterase class I)